MIGCLQEGQHIACLPAGQAGANPHVGHDGLPDVVPELSRTAQFVAAGAIVAPGGSTPVDVTAAGHPAAEWIEFAVRGRGHSQKGRGHRPRLQEVAAGCS